MIDGEICWYATEYFNIPPEEEDNGPVGSNHGNLQNTPLLALDYRALRGLPRCTARGEGEGA